MKWMCLRQNPKTVKYVYAGSQKEAALKCLDKHGFIPRRTDHCKTLDCYVELAGVDEWQAFVSTHI